ncbi:MAG: MBG-2 domain-containing protein, partial [Undibacterium sp.]|nr:MBG-2 domain-containing protein [Opitutaceae bacterium]
ATNPAFGGTFPGLVNGDPPAAVTGLQFTTTATTASGIGAYAITPGGAIAPNYALTFLPGTLTINRASLTLTAGNASRDFGAPNPAFTGTFAGFVNGDTAAVVSGLAFSTPPTATSAVGDYAITPFATAANYSFAFVPGTLRVTPPTVTVGTGPVPVVTVDNRPAITTGLAVINEDGRLKLVPVNPPGGTAVALDGQLAVTLGEATGLPNFQNGSNSSRSSTAGGPAAPNGPNFGNFELVPSLAGGAGLGAGGGIGSGQANEPGLFRESTINLGGFNVVYHEAVADARQQAASNTALGSSYREFSDDDNPQVNHVRAKVDRKPADSSAGRSTGGTQ